MVELRARYQQRNPIYMRQQWWLEREKVFFKGDLITERQECHPLLPPLFVHDGIKEYEVEKILNSQILHGKVEYLVHWKGYGVEEDEWHPIRDVQGSKQLIAEFHHTHPQAPHP